MKKQKTKPDIVILGEVIRFSREPRLYKVAAKNPEWVEKTVKGMMKAQGFKDPGIPMAILDSDLS